MTPREGRMTVGDWIWRKADGRKWLARILVWWVWQRPVFGLLRRGR